MGREPERTEFGQRMLAARKHAGLTQTRACERVGLRQATLSELETSGQGTSLVVQFADLYGVSPRWLATGEGEMLEATTLSPEALELARRLDRLRELDPQRRAAMLPFLRLALWADLPTQPAQKDVWAEELVNLFRSTLERSAVP